MTPDLDIPQPNAIDGAIGWFQATLVGSVATAVAIIAMACLGLLLLSGRLSGRRGIQLILGCFVVFGAPTIASGILNALSLKDDRAPAVDALPTAANVAPVPMRPLPPNQPYDPYAGAALPPRR